MYLDQSIIDIEDWCPLDDRPLQAPPKKRIEPVSRGNLLQVPNFIRNLPLDFLFEEFLNLNFIENDQILSPDQKNELLEICAQQIQDLQFEPLSPLLPEQPQSTGQTQNQESDKKIFNNMPGFLIGGLQSFHQQLELHDFGSTKICIVEKVKKCSDELIQNILMKLSSKHGNREQLRMLFNQLSGKFYDSLKKKSTNNKMIRKYFQLQEKYGAQVMNEAKCELREIYCRIMTKEWMYEHAMNRKFAGKNVEIKKETFYKYLVNFTQEIYQGEIPSLINREKVLSIELFQTR